MMPMLPSLGDIGIGHRTFAKLHIFIEQLAVSN